MRLILLPGRFAVCRLAPSEPLPDWITGSGGLSSITRTARELSIVCDEDCVPQGIRRESPWRALELEGSFEFDQVGVLLPIAATLADAGVSILPLATYDTDYVLIGAANIDLAIERLTSAGHVVTAR